MIKFIFELIAIYFLYQLIFNFIIPIFFAVNNTRKVFNKAMQQQQDAYQQSNTNGYNANTQSNQAKQNTPTKTKVSDEDYIDFEEIKD